MYFKVTNPDQIEMELNIAMKIKDWRELKTQIGTRWPASDLSIKITDMIIQAESTFYPKK